MSCTLSSIGIEELQADLVQWTIISTSFYCLTITFAKLSLLLLYLQLSPVKSFRIAAVWVLTYRLRIWVLIGIHFDHDLSMSSSCFPLGYDDLWCQML